MLFFRRESHPAKVINTTLDQLGLEDASSRLVVIGGAAMSLHGLKPIEHTDIDLVVSSDLMVELDEDLIEPEGCIATMPSAFATKRNELVRAGIRDKNKLDKATKNLHVAPIDLFVMPFDNVPTGTSEDLIALGEKVNGCRYLSLPLLRIYQMKVAVAKFHMDNKTKFSLSYPSRAGKHMVDAWKINQLIQQ